MSRVRADEYGWVLVVSLVLAGAVACKPTASENSRQPARGTDTTNEDEEQGADDNNAVNPVAAKPATNIAASPTTPLPPGLPTSITPGGTNSQPGGFAGDLGSLISQITGGSGLGGLTSGLGGLLNGGGLGGFDLGSLLNSFGGGGFTNGFGGQTNTNTAAPSSGSPNQIALVANTGDLRVDCLNAINQYRASKGRAALTLKNDDATNACVDKQSADDGAVGAAHRNFGKCGESAQNECPGWGGDTGTAQTGCLKMMWGEGPGGGHYENMANAAYKQVSCGYAQVGGKTWMIQNFYR